MTELKEKHPNLVEMRERDWRKHYRSLKTEEDKAQARAERTKQTTEKAKIIMSYQLQQRQAKRQQSSKNMASQYADGEQTSSSTCMQTHWLFVCLCHAHIVRLHAKGRTTQRGCLVEHIKLVMSYKPWLGERSKEKSTPLGVTNL